MSIKKEDFLKHLSDTALREQHYHNHKETIAWAAIVLYYVLIVGLIKVVEDMKDFGSWPYLGTVATCIIACATFVVVKILKSQYGLRQTAANVIAACYRLIGEYLPKDDECLQKIDFSMASLQEERKKFPKGEYRPPGHYPYILPNVLLDMMKKMDQIGHKPRTDLDMGSFLIVLLGFIISFTIFFWSDLLIIIGKY